MSIVSVYCKCLLQVFIVSIASVYRKCLLRLSSASVYCKCLFCLRSKLLKNHCFSCVIAPTSCIFSENPCAKMHTTKKSEKTVCFSREKFSVIVFKDYFLKKTILAAVLDEGSCDRRPAGHQFASRFVCVSVQWLFDSTWEPLEVPSVREKRTV